MIPPNARPTELKRLREELAEEASEIIARSSAYLSEEDSDRFRAIDADLDELNRREAQREKDLEMIRSRAKNGAHTEAGDGSDSRRAPEFMRHRDPFDDQDTISRGRYDDGDVISRALTAIEDAPRHLGDAGRERAMELVERSGKRGAEIARHILLTGSPEYHAEFEQYVRTTGRHLGPELQRALALSPDSAGGALVPFTLDASIVLSNSGIKAGIRGLATVISITTDSWNGVTSDGVTAQWLAENTAAADATPSFAQPAIPVYKAFAYVAGSYEALADSGFANQLGGLLGDAKARLDGAAFCTGSGSGQPTGLVTRAVATTASRVASAGATIAVADIFNISSAASPRHSESSVWFANKSTLNQIRQFSTGSMGGAFWTDLGPAIPSQLLGVGAYEESSMDTYRSGTTSTLLVLADPRSYYVIDRVGMTMRYNDMLMSTTTNTPLGQGGWACFWRTGGDLIAPAVSARVYRQNTTTSGWV